MAPASHLRGYVDIIGYMVVFIMATNVSTVRANTTCGRELGMKNGDITNDQITASTIDGTWYPSYARIGNANAWYPDAYDKNQWLQVDLRKEMVITGVQTQGHFWGITQLTRTSYYVETFKLRFRVESDSTWQDAFEGKVFQGNTGADQIKVNTFTAPIVASAIRFLPQTWHEGIALRVEILGCDLSDITCGEPPSISHAVVVTNHPGNSYGEWRTYECAAGFNSPLSKYNLLCSINGSWYWTNGAPDCTKLTTVSSPTISPVTAIPTVTSSTESTGNISGLSSTIPIAAGVAGGLVLLVVIIVIAIVCRRKSRGRSDTVKLEDIQDPPVRTEERPEEVDFVRNDLYESADNIRATEPRMGEHTEQDNFVRNDLYESVDRTSEDSTNVTLLPTNEGAAALYTAVNKKPRGADDSGMVDNIIYG